ncbi:MAG: hypothetical protein GY953_39780 [bacterium]|nr:hypothetical protein [bacterium]
MERNVRALNDRLFELPGLIEPPCRPDQKRVYYNHNMLFLDSSAAGFSREALRKALAAEGVRIRCSEYRQQHQLPVYSEAKWWHHKPTIPATMPGNEEVNRTRFFLPLFYEDAPELVAQYGKAFEKVWAHRAALAKM